MEREGERWQRRRTPGSNLVASWVMAAMLLIAYTFVAQFPDAAGPAAEAIAAR